jgi:hypothetical protein
MVKSLKQDIVLFSIEAFLPLAMRAPEQRHRMPGKRTVMGDTTQLPSLEEMKDQARRLRDALARQGTTINHAKSLELIASQHGFRDWNTLHAKIGNMPPPPKVLSIGDRVTGHYLGQAFAGTVIAIKTLTSAHGMQRVTFDFDEAVDVITFESWSAFRKRVTCTLGEDGRTVEKTSNGVPHMQLA